MSLTKVSYSMINGAVANVLDYGADPSGVNDCTTAFQSAIDSGMAVYVPKGTYKILSTLNVTTNTHMFGDDRNLCVIKFKPVADDILFQGPAGLSIGNTLKNLTFWGTEFYFDPEKTPLIKSNFFRHDSGIRLNWDTIHVYGFNADETIRFTDSIESYIYRSFFWGPYFNFGDSVGPTTTRTASCFLFNTPSNTTTHLMDCFIQGFKYGIQFVNAFSCRVERCTLEDNFIAIVSRKAFGTGSGLVNTVKDSYFEDNKYSLGGAGLAADYDDITNQFLQSNLFYQDCYFHNSPPIGGNSQADSPNLTYGNVRIQGTPGMRYLHNTFLSSQQGWSHVDNQYDTYLSPSLNATDSPDTLGTTGIQIGLRRDSTINGADKQFRLLLKTGASFAADTSFCLLANQVFDNTNPTSDAWDTSLQVVRFRIQGGNSYLSGGGAYNTSGADYAEMFEWFDGNPDNEDRVGRLVYLDGDKVTLDVNGDPIGVVSATASVIGNNWSEQWSQRILRDDFGREIRDDEGSPILNPDFDSTREYTPRNERKEWAVVGLLGRLRAFKDQPIPSTWVKLKDISETVAEYLVKS
jgi:hypothetical protein